MNPVRRQWPLFLLLLPLSFAAQSLSEQFGRATPAEAFLVAVLAAGGLLILKLLLQLFISKSSTASLSAACAGILFLYWSYPYLRIKAWSGDAISLTAILTGALLFWIGISWGVSRLSAAGQSKAFRFFNLLFGTLLLVNTGVYVLRVAASKSLVEGRVMPAKNTGVRPSVFILLFDEAGSIPSLRRRGIPDWGLDSFLAAHRFLQIHRSRSNYNLTLFSMASALNEEYLSLPADRELTLQDYGNALCAIRRSSVAKSFAESNYELRNLSVFSLAGQPPFGKYKPLESGTEALTTGTFWNRFVRPLWWKKTGQDSLEWFGGLQRNKEMISSLATKAETQKPQFAYAHFYLPHAPFYFDLAGNRLSFQASLEASSKENLPAFAHNWKAAVSYMEKAVKAVRQSHPNALILLMGDHGYRNEALPGNDTARFQNLCAVYFPDGNYAGFSDSTTLVNTMRLLHNKALGTALPLLPEKTFPLQETKKLDL